MGETTEDTDNRLSDLPSDEESKDPVKEEDGSGLPSGQETDHPAPADGEVESDAPTEKGDDSPLPSEQETDNPGPVDEKSEEENPPSAKEDSSDLSPGQEEDNAVPADENTQADAPVEEEEPSEAGSIEEESTETESTEEERTETESVTDSVSQNTISENTVSEPLIPENEADIFSVFPGLGDDYDFSSQELTDKEVLASHVEDIVPQQTAKPAALEDYQDVSDAYASGEVVYLAESKSEAAQVAEAFGGTLDSYSHEVAVISLPPKATVALAVTAAANPDIKLPAVWPNYYSYLDTDQNATLDPLMPSDPGFSNQWQHDYIGTRYAWAAGYKGEGIKVAVIDTGLAMNHTDLSANAIEGKNFVANAEGTPHSTDNRSHGTHVAGIIAADDNGKGGIGIAPDAKVSGYCVFPESGNADSADIMRAINAAVADKYDIINLSLGSPNYDANYEKVVNNAYYAGVAIFASSGNYDSDGNNFPASYTNVISVGAVNENGTRAYFSNYGKNIALSFPGVSIYSTLPTGYGYMSGTSQASPAAAGTAAVILSARDDIRKMTGKAKVNALLAAMKSSTTKCATAGMGAGTTYLPGVLHIATEITAPETPVIDIVNEADYRRGSNNKDYIAESIEVTLSTQTAVGVDIYYSTSGKAPTYKNGDIKNADNTAPYTLGTPITLTGAKSKTIKAIAVNPVSGKVSAAASKTVTLTPIPTAVDVAPAGNVQRIAAGKSLKFTAAVTPSYAISNKVAWSVVDESNRDARAKGITVKDGTVKTTAAQTPAGTYQVIATPVGSNGITFNGTPGSYTFTVIESSDIKKVAFLDGATKKAPKAGSIKTTDSRTTDSGNKIIDLKEYLVVTKTDPVSKTDTVLSGTTGAGEVVWSSSNAKIATVSDGIITAVSPGKAVIKATSNDGSGKSASYNVTVVAPVTAITISGFSKVAAGKTITLTAKVEPENASNKKVNWTISGGGNLVSISKSSGKITAKKGAVGQYTVTAVAADGLGARSANYTVSIANEEITKITLSQKKLTMFPPGTSATNNITAALTAKVEGKTSGSSTVSVLVNPLITWSSSAPSIASVDQTGKITARAPGKTTITCAAADGSKKKAACTVTVSVPMSKLVIGPTAGNEGHAAIGKKIKMAAKYYSNYGKPANKKVLWEIVSCSSQTLLEKTTIDKNGNVSVKKDLTLSSPNAYIGIQATAADGSGVSSNVYIVYITPRYLTARLKQQDTDGSFIIQATTKKTRPTDETADWVQISDYCTATISASKKCGLYKNRVNDKKSYYAYYYAFPAKATNLNLDTYDKLSVKILNKIADKITLTIKLKDGSNLSAKQTFYAVYYIDTGGYKRIAYFF